jgi:nicotinate-nucleotide pyrophosphorylase (carboxylating)
MKMNNEFLQDSRIGRLIELALQEDIGFGDVTSESLIPEDQFGRAILLAKESGVISGIDIADLVFRIVDPLLTTKRCVNDGSVAAQGQILAEIDGHVRSIVMGERVALNFLQRMSGIASTTHKYVHAIAGTGARITDTRKTVPGLRMLEKKAVRDGGGVNHRFGLDQMVMIKDNHIAAAGSITEAVRRCKTHLKERHIDVKIEVETTTLGEVREALECSGIDRIMLDNFAIDAMRDAVGLIGKKVEVEASGGITLQTVRAIAETGVDFISVGALTHSPKALDISLELVP